MRTPRPLIERHIVARARNVAIGAIALLASLLVPAAPANAVDAPMTVAYETCRTPTFCVAVGNDTKGGAIATTVDGAQHWQRRSVPAGVMGLESVTCPADGLCIAVGWTAGNAPAIVKTTNGGSTWTARSVVPDDATPTSSLHSVSCPTTTTCHAVGNDRLGSGIITKTTDAGSTWRVESRTGTAPLSGISCAWQTAHCVAVGSDYSGSDFVALALTSHDGGATWTATYRRPDIAAGSGTMYRLHTVSCTGPTCMALGWSTGIDGERTILAVSTDDGRHWRSIAGPTNGGAPPNGVRCATARTCHIVGGATFATSTDAGSSWVRRTLPAGTNDLSGVACVGDVPNTCTIWGAASQISTTDAGAHWVRRAHP